MPWFPDFVSGVELARRKSRIEGQADPVAQYLTALNEGDTRVLENAWPGEVVVYGRVSYLLQPMASRRTAARQASDSRA